VDTNTNTSTNVNTSANTNGVTYGYFLSDINACVWRCGYRSYKYAYASGVREPR
jgi:hypothetical protein